MRSSRSRIGTAPIAALAAPGYDVAVAKNKKEPVAQMNLRLARAFVDRLDKAARNLNIDRTALIRLILAEKLPEYEKRGREATGEKDG